MKRLLLACCMAVTGAFASAQLYFSDLFLPDVTFGQINRVNPDGTQRSVLVDTGGGVRGLAIDRAAGKMYWADVNSLVIKRSNLDGSDQEAIVQLPGGEEPAFPSALTISNGKLYWGDQTLGTVNRANLDGSSPETLFSTPFHRGLAIDDLHQKLYWSTSISDRRGEVWRANLDGSNRELVLATASGDFKPNKIALDVSGGKIYWTDYVVDVVMRANLDGTQMETLYVPPFNRNPQGITLDLDHGKVYWGQDIEIEGATGKIMVMNLDGTGIRNLVDGFGHVNEIVYEPPQSVEILVPFKEFIALGKPQGGDLASWAADDGNARRLCKFFVPTLTSPVLDVQLDYRPTTVIDPSELLVSVKVAQHTPGPLSLTLTMFKSDGTSDNTSVMDAPITDGVVYTGSVPSSPDTYKLGDGRYRMGVKVWQRGPSTSLFPCVSFEYGQLVFSG